MSFKTLANRVTSKVGHQVLTAQKHSPIAMLAVGAVGMGATVVLACRATLKMSDILDEAGAKLQADEEHMNRSFEVSHDETEKDKERFALAVDKHAFSIKLQTAIKIAKLYAPAVLVGAASVGLMTGSHLILRKRNAGLVAAYAVVDKSFKDYRSRVIEDQGKEKDLEYRFGTTEREIVEEGPNGPEVRYVKGLDPNAIKATPSYAKIFDEYNSNWSNVPHQNQYFVQSAQNFANDMLRVKGRVYLNDVYDLLGLDREEYGQVVGWVKDPKNNEGDGYIDFGVWNGSTFAGKEWVAGNVDGILLDFNVDGVVLDLLKKA